MLPSIQKQRGESQSLYKVSRVRQYGLILLVELILVNPGFHFFLMSFRLWAVVYFSISLLVLPNLIHRS